MKDTKDLEIKLRETEQEAKRLREELEAARREAEKPKKWEPPTGPYCIRPNGEADMWPSVGSWARAGSEYPTLEAAEAANRRITFFRRLCALATELNPSGRAAGRWNVGIAGPEGPWVLGRAYDAFADSLFETEEAARKAAEIMNRDGWSWTNGGGLWEDGSQ